MNENSYQFILRNIRRSENLLQLKSVERLIANQMVTESNKHDLETLKKELIYSMQMRGFSMDQLHENNPVVSNYELEVQYQS
jgi:hypothetical protein